MASETRRASLLKPQPWPGANVHRSVLVFGDVEIGEHSRIDANVVLSGPLKIGRYVHIGVGCFLTGSGPGIEMEDYTALSPGCKVFASTDDYSGVGMTNPTVPPAARAPVQSGRVLIRRHAIIGANSVILPGVTICEGAACGALSLISASLAPWTIYGGVPAKRIKDRQRVALEKEPLCK